MEKICPIVKTLNLLGKKWNLLILKQISDNEKKRFNELLGDINGISSRTLSKRLDELEEAKIVSKTRFNEIPPRVEYSLTEQGKELIGCFKYIDGWARKYA